MVEFEKRVRRLVDTDKFFMREKTILGAVKKKNTSKSFTPLSLSLSLDRYSRY